MDKASRGAWVKGAWAGESLGEAAEGGSVMRFKGRIALITAAGRGIGRATAEIIGREGGTVVGVEVDKESRDQVVGVIRAAGATAHGLVADALDAAQAAGAGPGVGQ